MSKQWIWSQIGSREHFTIPAILAENDRLEKLLCDYWSRPHRLWERIPATGFKKLGERSHPSIPGSKVQDTGLARLIFDHKEKKKNSSVWQQIHKRNQWYQQWQLKRLNKPATLRRLQENPGIFFSFSYATKDLFKFFKDLGWELILGQIDPGKLEEDLVREESQKFPEYGQNWSSAPAVYWEGWTSEIELADRIWVNSEWSKEAMIRQEVPAEKVEIIPLAYPANPAIDSAHNYPESFSSARPFRLLFLGQINIRKGAHLLMQAMDLIRDEPVALEFVGPLDMVVPESINDPRIHFHGSVSRQETQSHFKNSDAFVLPTLSDGFAITQLEAQAQQLPLITSKFCAPVVRDKVNGLLLNDLQPATIASAISYCVTHPKSLRKWSENSKINDAYKIESLSEQVLAN